jgi:hypothetical protein
MTISRPLRLTLAAKDGDTARMSTARILRNTWWWRLT